MKSIAGSFPQVHSRVNVKPVELHQNSLRVQNPKKVLCRLKTEFCRFTPFIDSARSVKVTSRA
jgi:hypothetical protein